MSDLFEIDVAVERGALGFRATLASDAGVIAVLGPSGAGKSTLLEVVAGLLRPSEGRVRIAGETMFDRAAGVDRPPHARRVGMVFQDARLFPHRSVLDNLRYGIRRDGPNCVSEEEAIERLGLAALLAKRPRELSGGERQRVAIARALLSRPRILLLDEPFASLDAALRASASELLAMAFKRAELPTLLVTHRVEEAETLTDACLLVRDGRAVGHGTRRELAERADAADFGLASR